jgi:hypothetical protein
MKPSVGRIVHYVSYGTPGGEFTSQCRAAIITEVDPTESRILGGPGRVGLAVLNPTGIFLHSLDAGGCKYNEGGETPGDPSCPLKANHGNPHRYCQCGWIEAHLVGGTWHWPERVE